MTPDMTIEEAAKAIEELHDTVEFESGVVNSKVSELTQLSISQAIDFLSLAHSSMVIAQLNHTRELAEWSSPPAEPGKGES